MSAVARLDRAFPTPAPPPAGSPAPARRAHLAPVAAPEHSRSMVPFFVLCFAIIVGALVAVLVLNTSMAAAAYESRDLRIELATLTEQRGDLLARLDTNAAPQRLAAQAEQLGMVPASAIGFLSIEGQTVVGGGAGE